MRSLMLAIALASTAGAAIAEESVPWCSVDPVDRFQYLRRLSLDLRQRIPALDEYESLESKEAVPAELIDAWLDGPEFRETVRAYHRDLLWPNLRGALLFNAVTQLTPTPGDPNGRMYVMMDERSIAYRGMPGGKSCADRPQLEFEADGTPIPGPDGLDGWVEVEPYWSPGTKIRVCAYDAQATIVADDFIDGEQVQMPCYVTGGYVSKKCGCGPNLAFCNHGFTRNRIRQGLEEQMLRLIENVVAEDRPYTDVLLSRNVEVNGPASHYLRWQWGFAADVYVAPDGDWKVPEVPFVESKTWARGQRGPAHAGILTMPAYLLRFQTNRSRAHRFHNAFLCQPFEPPPGGLQLFETDEPDVAKRPGCSYCHQTLEPAAAYWGRYVEQGSSWLDPLAFPIEEKRCADRDWKNDPILRRQCMRVYIAEREPAGVLRAFEFARDGSPEANQLARHANEGPRAFAEVAIADGRFARCTVRRWWRQMLRREPTENEEQTVVPELAAEFSKNGWKLKELVKSIVTSDAYRRAP